MNMVISIFFLMMRKQSLRIQCILLVFVPVRKLIYSDLFNTMLDVTVSLYLLYEPPYDQEKSVEEP